MKNLKIILVLAITLIIASCGSQKQIQKIPMKKVFILSQDSIQALEKAENLAVLKRFALVKSLKPSMKNQPLVSNIFEEMDLRSVIGDISNNSGIVIIPDQTVQGYVSATLEDVPLEKALDMVLYSGGYEYKYIEDGNYYIVGTALPENPSFDDLSITRIIKTDGPADRVMDQISEFYKPFIKQNGQTITITASYDIINRIEKDIALIDRNRRQIEISAEFIMIEWDKGTNIGARWGDINLSAAGIGNIFKGGSDFSLDIVSGLNSFFSANGYSASVNIVARPKIVVEDGEEGELKIIEEHLFLILSGGGSSYNYFTTKDIEVGIKLKVKPIITRDGKIRLELNPEVSDIIGEREFKSGKSTQKLPIISRRSTQTVLRVSNGETIAIGGLSTKIVKKSRSGVPIVSAVPIFGGAFGAKDKQHKETELVIFVTARVIN